MYKIGDRIIRIKDSTFNIVIDDYSARINDVATITEKSERYVNSWLVEYEKRSVSIWDEENFRLITPLDKAMK